MNTVQVIKKDGSNFVAEIARVIKTGNDAKLIVKFLEEKH